MECNRDEATRAKEIAEKKFAARDVTGAKKFAVKAQNLFPNLEGIPQMLATLDVHVAAENRVNGEVDWYAILGVDPRADDEAVRKQYRKLALMLHPDKNKSVGADGAFKLLSEAWSLLSDKGKRGAFDQRRNALTSQGPPGVNGFYNFTKSSTSSTKPPKSNSRAARSPAPGSNAKPKPSTFWTLCHKCKMQYEYMRVYLNHNLLCPNCHETFFAVEITPPPTGASKSSTSWNSSHQRHNSNHEKSSYNTGRSRDIGGPAGFTESYHQNNFQWGPFSKTTGASSAAQAASVVQQAYEKAKREREEAQAATRREEVLRRKQQASSKKASGGSSNAGKRRKGTDDVGASVKPTGDVMNQMGGIANFFVPRQPNFEPGRVNGAAKFSITRDFSVLEVQYLLADKARKEIHRRLNEVKSQTAVKQAGNGNEADKSMQNIDARCDQNKSGEPVDRKNGASERKHSGTSSAIADAETLQSMTITVPDSDFHDFDRDRTEGFFGENQVWAAYDGDDGMPRYYAIIHSVISVNPFKMRISWLNSKTNSELGPLNWIASGFTKTCGDFRVGKYEINKSLNSFSHKVRWTKGARGMICIHPKKGDVWALYRNWSLDWNELTADEVIHKYDMVEVVEDYNEELGVTVAPLVKVAGFKSVFHRHLDPREVRRIPREEMFRFSHHVPSYLHTGLEASKAPKGCRELDPAATPLELLQVITDAKEEEMIDEKPKEVDVENTDAKDEDIMEIDEKHKAVDVENSNGIEEEIAEDSRTVREEEKGSSVTPIIEL